MKHKNLLKAVQKHAQVIEVKKKEITYVYSATNEYNTIEWYVQKWDNYNNDIRPPFVCAKNNRVDTRSDYFSGFFCDTIKSAIAAFTYVPQLNKEIND